MNTNCAGRLIGKLTCEPILSPLRWHLETGTETRALLPVAMTLSSVCAAWSTADSYNKTGIAHLNYVAPVGVPAGHQSLPDPTDPVRLLGVPRVHLVAVILHTRVVHQPHPGVEGRGRSLPIQSVTLITSNSLGFLITVILGFRLRILFHRLYTRARKLCLYSYHR